jgi:hypothetical protein
MFFFGQQLPVNAISFLTQFLLSILVRKKKKKKKVASSIDGSNLANSINTNQTAKHQS